MGFRISSVERGGLGDELGLRRGDELIMINGEKVVDLIDYQQLMSCEELVLTLRDGAGELVEVECDKDMDEQLDVEFEQDLLGPVRLCANNCCFCFVSQLPRGMRKTLYVKDDDWRMSLMMGNYVTLTNVSDRELERIIRRNASPLYISVHASDGPTRARLMGQPRAARLMDQLGKLRAGGISFHGQVVLCPGLNDGEVLERTVRDMAALYPCCQTLALVPVGLTGHRAGLCGVRPCDARVAEQVLEQTARWQQEFLRTLGTRLVFAADEFYVLAGRDVPPEDEYEDYPQIDNGVGLMRKQRDEFERAWREFGESGRSARARRVLIVTGESARSELEYLACEHPLAGVDVRVRAVKNEFFGGGVTVAGLLTGRDIVAQVGRADADEVLITRSMLRDGGDVLLDGMSVDELAARLGCPVRPVMPEGEALLNALAGED